MHDESATHRELFLDVRFCQGEQNLAVDFVRLLERVAQLVEAAVIDHRV